MNSFREIYRRLATDIRYDFSQFLGEESELVCELWKPYLMEMERIARTDVEEWELLRRYVNERRCAVGISEEEIKAALRAHLMLHEHGVEHSSHFFIQERLKEKEPPKPLPPLKEVTKISIRGHANTIQNEAFERAVQLKQDQLSFLA